MENKFTSHVDKAFLEMMDSFNLPEKFNLIVGFSGGADSSALLHLAYAHRNDIGCNLYAIHINHLIRNDEAYRDEAFCENTCKQYGIDYKICRIDVPSVAKQNKEGVEEAARNVRYREFENYANEVSKNKLPTYIATAHNADDNAETVIFNLARGSALNGLCGIKHIRGNIIRPIILSSKDDIIGYCRENCIEYIIDSTNSETVYTRNHIRHSVIPVLKEINPSLLSAISRMTENLTQDELFLRQSTFEFLALNTNVDGMDLDELNNASQSIKKRAIFEYVKDMTGVLLEDKHISAIIELCEKAVKHSKIHFVGDYCAEIKGDRLIVSDKAIKPEIEYFAKVDFGITDIPEGVIGRFKSADTKNISEFQNIYKKSTQTLICSAKIKGALFATSRRSGDTININGVNRKLKKLLNEIEPDLDKRACLPIFRDDDGILWVPGARSRTESFPKQDEDAEVLLYAYFKDNK